MPRATTLLTSLALAAGALAQALVLAPGLSFGHEGRISRDSISIPDFHLLGNQNQLQILSNKIILTPISPGNQRAAVWSANHLQEEAWTTEVEFRTNGPERGGGKLTVWLARNGEQEVGTSSIYTVGKFDGLALTLDTYDGTAGTIRGFLNDGSNDYKSHHNVDSLAFGHCQYSYRNLGRLSRLVIKQDKQKFQVNIDDRLCFETDKIQLPTGYYFGISAVSGENPDSFEVNKLVVIKGKADVQVESQNAPRIPDPIDYEETKQAPAYSDKAIEDPPEIDADKVETSRQFADLHNRLQAILKHVSALHRDYTQGRKNEEQKLTAMHKMLSKQQYSSGSTPSSLKSDELLRSIDQRLIEMDSKFQELSLTMRHLKAAVMDTSQIDDLKQNVKDTHSSLLSAAPRHGFLVFTILGSQALLVSIYVFYKRRRANSSKKFL